MSTTSASLIGDEPVTCAHLSRELGQLRDELVAEIRAGYVPKSLLRMDEVERRVGLKKSSIQAKISAGEFPAPVELGGGRAIGFLSTELDSWIEVRIAASRRNGAAARGARTPIKAQRAREERNKPVLAGRTGAGRSAGRAPSPALMQERPAGNGPSRSPS